MTIQLLIAVVGGIAIFLTQQRDDRLTKFACIFGLASQPLFLYETYIAEQWGMFLLAIMYTASFLFGVFNFWIRRQPEPTPLAYLFFHPSKHSLGYRLALTDHGRKVAHQGCGRYPIQSIPIFRREDLL